MFSLMPPHWPAAAVAKPRAVSGERPASPSPGAQLCVEARGLPREVLSLQQAGRGSGGVGVQPCRGRWITITLMQVRPDGVIAGESRVEIREGGQAGPR